jgi:uncharacterized membrane protein (UPF0127 family)
VKNLFLILISLAFCLLLIITFFFQNQEKSFVIINKQKFTVNLAISNQQKEKGLSILNSLPLNKGMLFPFEKSGIYVFWMKGMKFPIDIIYIQNNKIVEIFKDLPNPKTTNEAPAIAVPKQKANYVLEINSGLSSKYNFKTGDNVFINL